MGQTAATGARGNGTGKGKGTGEEKADEGEPSDEVRAEEVKENVAVPLRKVATYTKRVPTARRGKGRGSMRSRRPPAMDVIEWTPAPYEDQHSRDWGSVEV